MLRARGLLPAGKGEPLALNAPSLIEKTETVPSDSLATKTPFPKGSTATESGEAPVAKGEPVTAVSAPLPAVIAKAETVLALPLVT